MEVLYIYQEEKSILNEWCIKKKEIIDLLDYFKLYPLRSAKFARVNLIPKYYELRKLGGHRTSENSVLGKA
jgi:hypothetical protein